VKYLKLAAESGIIEAQHNLGCEYLDGLRLKKDEVKALAWFLHAGANGFI
jgi:TPR repeat protein